MKKVEQLIGWFDSYQRNHRFVGFPLAVIRKYGDDHAGHQAALLSYYAFLAVFPLFLALEAVLSLTVSNNPSIRHELVDGATAYFPIVGQDIAKNIQETGQSVIALVVGLAVALFGARGVADSFRDGINHVWQVPRVDRLGFPKTILNSITTLFVGGLGFLLAPLLSVFAFSLGGHGLLVRCVALAVTLGFLFIVFLALVRNSLPGHITNRQLWPAAALSTVGLVILQSFGSYILTNQISRLDNLYGTFAIVLGLLFWLYLQAQVFFFAVEAASIGAFKLWPRAIDQNNLTPQDKKALELYAQRNKFNQNQRIKSIADTEN